jgi:K+-transporting ATPase KdpF subunit
MTPIDWGIAVCAVALCGYLVHSLIHPDRY